MNNLNQKDNLALIVGRQGQAVGGDDWNIVFVTDGLVDMNIFARGGGMTFPLYLYNESSSLDFKQNDRTPNLNIEEIEKISRQLDLSFIDEKVNDDSSSFAPEDLLDYIYSVFHSRKYRNKYEEFLNVDFPRVPLPKTKQFFWGLVALGSELRQIHLLESPLIEKYITQYPEDGNNVVEKPNYKKGNVYINANQHFTSVPESVWNFYIGGYQPAQKWLKDRKGEELNFEDILHYQKMIVALSETDRIMKEIDKIEI